MVIVHVVNSLIFALINIANMIQNIYPTVECEHPVTVQNPYTHEFIKVPCGCCKTCALKRSRKMSLLCSFEEKDYKYTWFVTLTYTQDNIPYIEPVFDSDESEFEFIFHNPRNKFDKSLINSDFVHHYKGKNISYLVDKCRLLNRGISVLDKTDAQKFIKRIRYYINKHFNENIRYYCVGEYGPKTLRPHFHFILFTNSQEVSASIPELVSKSWSLGRVDASLSRHGVSSYVAGYVNSTVSLPSLYAFCEAKPFSLHSNFFATGFFKSQRQKIYSDEPYQFVYNLRELFGSVVEFHPWRSLTSMFFPKCFRYNEKSRQELYKSYTIILEAWRYFGIFKPWALSQIILDEWLKIGDGHPCVDYFGIPLLYEAAKYSKSVKSFDKAELDFVVKSHIYNELRVSFHFISFVCDNGFDYRSRCKALDKIINFYKWKDYDNLKNFYRMQEMLSTDLDFGKRRLPFMYDNFSLSLSNRTDIKRWLLDTYDCFTDNYINGFDDIQHSKYYTDLVYKSCKEFRDANKLKYLNDIHKMFDYE